MKGVSLDPFERAWNKISPNPVGDLRKTALLTKLSHAIHSHLSVLSTRESGIQGKKLIEKLRQNQKRVDRWKDPMAPLPVRFSQVFRASTRVCSAKKLENIPTPLIPYLTPPSWEFRMATQALATKWCFLRSCLSGKTQKILRFESALRKALGPSGVILCTQMRVSESSTEHWICTWVYLVPRAKSKLPRHERLWPL